jgi:F0F1-type ATP synthase alpha subunit
MLVKVSSLNSLNVLELEHTCEHLHSFLPGCEVFSRYVFYLHSWLLKRVVKISGQTNASSLATLG